MQKCLGKNFFTTFLHRYSGFLCPLKIKKRKYKKNNQTAWKAEIKPACFFQQKVCKPFFLFYKTVQTQYLPETVLFTQFSQFYPISPSIIKCSLVCQHYLGEPMTSLNLLVTRSGTPPATSSSSASLSLTWA